MPWFKVDDNLAFHHKVVAAGNAAMGLWVRAGALCAQQLTDGFVPDHMITALDGRKHVRRLVEVGLWTAVEGGYQFHEWTERQPTRESVEADREAARQRMKALRSGGRSSRERSEDVRANNARSSGAVRDPRPDPTRPSSSKRTTSPRAAGLPDTWQPSTAHRALAAERRINIDEEADKFRDWVASKGETRKDWEATFRNWIRNARPTLAAVPTDAPPAPVPLPNHWGTYGDQPS